MNVFDILRSPVDQRPIDPDTLVSGGGVAHNRTEAGILHLDSDQVRLSDQVYAHPQLERWANLTKDVIPYYTSKKSIAGKIANAGYRGLRTFNHAKESEWILDIGCGNGAQADLLDNHSNYIGLDRNAQRLGMMLERHPNATAIYGDAGALPFKDKTLKYVFSSFAFEHIWYLKDAVMEIDRCTTDDATVIIVIPTEGGLWNLGRNLISKPRFTKKYPDLDFEFVSHVQHCNQATQVIRTLETFFKVKRRYMPTLIPSVYCNIFVELICTKQGA